MTRHSRSLVSAWAISSLLVRPSIAPAAASRADGFPRLVEPAQPEMTTDALSLGPFRLRTARPVEEQHRRQAELAGQMVDDLDRRVPVVVEEAAVGAQHAELQGETPAMIGTAALGDDRQIRRRQAPVPRQFVLARIG